MDIHKRRRKEVEGGDMYSWRSEMKKEWRLRKGKFVEKEGSWKKTNKKREKRKGVKTEDKGWEGEDWALWVEGEGGKGGNGGKGRGGESRSGKRQKEKEKRSGVSEMSERERGWGESKRGRGKGDKALTWEQKRSISLFYMWVGCRRYIERRRRNPNLAFFCCLCAHQETDC